MAGKNSDVSSPIKIMNIKINIPKRVCVALLYNCKG